MNPAPAPEIAFPHVVLVNYNLPGDTLGCIASLRAAGCPPGHILVVDNASQDDSPARIRQAEPQVTLLCSLQNRGYAAGCNLGIRRALEQGAEWVLLLNNDTWVAPDFFTALMTQARVSGSRLLGPAIFWVDEPQRLWFLAGRRLLGTLLTRDPWRNRPLPSGLPAELAADFLNGCALLLHRAVVEKVGLLSERYFMYGEEVDYCLRAAVAGFRLGAVPAARMWHKVSRSSQREGERTLFLRTRNQVWIYRQWAGWPQRILLFLFSWLRGGWQALRRQKGDRAARRALWNGLKTGWFGPRGWESGTDPAPLLPQNDLEPMREENTHLGNH